MTQGAGRPWAGPGAEDRGSEQAGIQLVPLTCRVQGCLLAKHSVIICPAHATMAQSLPQQESGIRQEVTGCLVRGADGCVRKETIHPHQWGPHLPQSGAYCCWQLDCRLAVQSVELSLESHIVREQFFHIDILARLDFRH